MADDGIVANSLANPLLDANCFALVLATGLRASHGNIDPSSQEQVIQFGVHRLIVARDVGEENVGSTPNPWPVPKMHVSYRPGTFTGGMPSKLQQLVRFYEDMPVAAHKLVLMLISLGRISPTGGIAKNVFRDEAIAGGIVARYLLEAAELGTPITEWERDLQIIDADLALGEFPKVLSDRIISAIEAINPFWPKFSLEHRLTW
jgi:hypothetical protein